MTDKEKEYRINLANLDAVKVMMAIAKRGDTKVNRADKKELITIAADYGIPYWLGFALIFALDLGTAPPKPRGRAKNLYTRDLAKNFFINEAKLPSVRTTGAKGARTKGDVYKGLTIKCAKFLSQMLGDQKDHRPYVDKLIKDKKFRDEVMDGIKRKEIASGSLGAQLALAIQLYPRD